MDSPRRIARIAIIAAIPVELLLRAAPWGVNLPLASAIVAGTLLWLTDRADPRWRVRALLGATLVGLASITAFRAESMLWLAVLVAMVATLGLMVLPDAARAWRGEPLGVFLRGLLAIGQSATGPLRLIQPGLEWPREERVPGRLAHVRGLAWSIPVALPFVLLFAEADPVFGAALRDLVDVPRLVTHVVLWGVFAWLVLGWLLSAQRPWRLDAVTGAPISARETVWVLGALVVVFDVFVALQFRWFFGGDELPRYMSGLTYAEYARRGFFELVTAGTLLLGVLLLADWATRDAERRERRHVRLLSGLLLGLLAVVLTSALLRMQLYVDAYGLTQLRFFTTAFMIWLVVVFVWFALTILRERRDLFMTGVYASGVLAVFALAAIDPIGRIAAFNVERARETGRFDSAYALELGDDAVPVLAAALGELPAESRCELHGLFAPRAENEAADWRSTNVSRVRADRIRRELSPVAPCPAPAAR